MGGTSPEEVGRAVTPLHALKARRHVTDTRGHAKRRVSYAINADDVIMLHHRVDVMLTSCLTRPEF